MIEHICVLGLTTWNNVVDARINANVTSRILSIIFSTTIWCNVAAAKPSDARRYWLLAWSDPSPYTQPTRSYIAIAFRMLCHYKCQLKIPTNFPITLHRRGRFPRIFRQTTTVSITTTVKVADDMKHLISFAALVRDYRRWDAAIDASIFTVVFGILLYK